MFLVGIHRFLFLSMALTSPKREATSTVHRKRPPFAHLRQVATHAPKGARTRGLSVDTSVAAVATEHITRPLRHCRAIEADQVSTIDGASRRPVERMSGRTSCGICA